MKNKLLIALILFISINSLYGMAESEKLKIEVNISNSFFDKAFRFFNINNTVLNIEFINQTNTDIVIQNPICNWNIFITIIDSNDKEIHTSLFEIHNPVIDSSSYTTLKANEKTVYEYKLSYFGDFKGSYSNIKKIKLEYIPQKAFYNKNFNSIILEKHITDLKLIQ